MHAPEVGGVHMLFLLASIIYFMRINLETLRGMINEAVKTQRGRGRLRIMETTTPFDFESSDDDIVEKYLDARVGGPIEIDFATLQRISPAAAAAYVAARKNGSDYPGDEQSPSPIWVLDNPMATGEIELAQWLTEEWSNLSVNYDGKQVVLFCGGHAEDSGGAIDDEYGNMWNNADQEWSNYMF
jgi:hypothetical protein